MGEYVRKTARWNGKKYEATGKTELEAMTKLAEKLATAKRGEETIGGAMTVSAWYKEWKATYKDHKGLTAKSLGMYDEKFNRYIRPRIGAMKLRDVKDVHLQHILNGQEGMSYSHVQKLRRVMREMFSRARKSRLIAVDPSEDLELPAAPEGTHRSLTDAERAVLLKVAEHHHAGLYVLTLLYTGMRPGEAAALTWADVDFRNREIHIHAALESGTGRDKGPKTEAGVRYIPIRAALLPRLLSAKGNPFDRVFKSRSGHPLNSNSQYRLWKDFKRAMDIEMGAKVYRNRIEKSVIAADLTPYCLRHTFATDCAAAGVPLETVRWYLGHEDISTTANIYQHRDSRALHAGIAILDGAGGKSGGTTKNA